MDKRPICFAKLRKVPPQFSWVDQRLVRDRYIEQLSHEACALYLFLVTVADAQGLSYYADLALCQRLSLSGPALYQARQALIARGLIAYQRPLYQVLALDAAPQEATTRASAGAVEHVAVGVVTNLARYLGDVKSGSLWVVGAAGDAPRSMWQADLSGGLALVFGAEGKGLRPLVRRTCDELVSIPLEGSVESLNVSVAAAVLMYEAKRQRG